MEPISQMTGDTESVLKCFPHDLSSNAGASKLQRIYVISKHVWPMKFPSV